MLNLRQTLHIIDINLLTIFVTIVSTQTFRSDAIDGRDIDNEIINHKIIIE